MKIALSPRVALIVIAAMFFLPLVLAWLMYTGAIDYRPGSTRNLGQLVQPPKPVAWGSVSSKGSGGQSPADMYAGHWLILHAVPTPCGADCLRDITELRQVHRASGKQQSRIRLGLLHDLDSPATILEIEAVYGLFQLLEDPGGSVWELLEAVANISQPPVSARGSTYLIDPLGNIMMFYPAGYDPRDLSRDLKRLLTWSKLDENS